MLLLKALYTEKCTKGKKISTVITREKKTRQKII